MPPVRLLGWRSALLLAVTLLAGLEFAEEGDRFPDLVRSGNAVTVLGISADRQLFPIPQSEIDVAPAVTQNQGTEG